MLQPPEDRLVKMAPALPESMDAVVPRPNEDAEPSNVASPASPAQSPWAWTSSSVLSQLDGFAVTTMSHADAADAGSAGQQDASVAHAAEPLPSADSASPWPPSSARAGDVTMYDVATPKTKTSALRIRWKGMPCSQGLAPGATTGGPSFTKKSAKGWADCAFWRRGRPKLSSIVARRP